MKRLFVDMDGCLSTFNHADNIETLFEKGYFASLSPMTNVIDGLKQFMKENPEVEVNILSAVLAGSKYALAEKKQWLDKYLPETKGNRIFTQCGSNKADFVPGGIRPTDVLLDDYSHNLHNWPGQGIKVYNGINGSFGTWDGPSVSFDDSPKMICRSLENALGIEKNKTLKCLKVEPGAIPETAEIENSLASLQEAVGGFIEVYDIDDCTVIICNEEGKLIGLPLNRGICDENQKLVEIIAGTFLVVGSDPELGEFTSLSEDEIAKYDEMFHDPEEFLSLNGRIMVFKTPVEESYKDSLGQEDIEYDR